MGFGQEAMRCSNPRCLSTPRVFRRVITRLFTASARFTARRPWRTIALACMTVLLLSCGIARLKIETGYDSVWVPTRTRSAADRRFIGEHYRRAPRAEFILVEAREPVVVPASAKRSRGALTTAALDMALTAHEMVVRAGLGRYCVRAVDASRPPPLMRGSSTGAANVRNVSAVADANAGPDPMAPLRAHPAVLNMLKDALAGHVGEAEADGQCGEQCTLARLESVITQLCPRVAAVLIAPHRAQFRDLLREPRESLSAAQKAEAQAVADKAAAAEVGESDAKLCPLEIDLGDGGGRGAGDAAAGGSVQGTQGTQETQGTQDPGAAVHVDAGDCVVHSLLSAWDFNRTRIAEEQRTGAFDVRLRAALAGGGAGAGRPAGRGAVPLQTRYGELVVLQDVAAGLVCGAPGTRGAEGAPCRADALQTTYLLDAALHSKEELLQFESALLRATRGVSGVERAAVVDVQAELSAVPGSLRLQLQVYRTAQRSFFDANIAGTERDMPLAAASFVLMSAYASCMLGGKPPRESRLLLACAAATCVAMAMACAFGLAGYFGVPYNETAVMSIFILLGVGIDDMFIICACFERTAAAGDLAGSARDTASGSDDGSGGSGGGMDDRVGDHDMERRLHLALHEAGVSVSLTSLTSLFAFVIGGVTIDLPGIRAFCLLCGFGVFNVAWLQLTFFAAVLVMDERRRLAQHADCCFWRELAPASSAGRHAAFRDGDGDSSRGGGGGAGGGGALDRGGGHPTAAEEAGPGSAACALRDASAGASSGDDRGSGGGGGGCACPEQPARVVMRRLFARRFAPWLLSRRMAVTLGFAALLAFCLAGWTRVAKGMRVLDFLPSDTHAHAFFEAQGRLFGDVAMSSPYLEFVFEDAMEPTGPGAAARAMHRCVDRVRALGFVRPPVEFWLEEYEAGNWSANAAATPAERIGAFLLVHPRFAPDVVLSATGLALQTSRFRAAVAHADSMDARLRDMMLARGACAGIAIPDGAVLGASAAAGAAAGELRVAAYEPGYLWLERYAMIDQMVAQNVLLALSANFFILLLVHGARSAAIITLLVASVDACIIGAMGWWGINLHLQTLMCLVLALGFAVDYSIHIAEAFIASAPPVAGAASAGDGRRSARAAQALTSVGPSVLNGGVSTFLAVCLMGFTRDYAFVTFFQMFTLIVCFGLAHGLVMLPVLLSWLGPPPLARACPATASGGSAKLSPHGVGRGRVSGVRGIESPVARVAVLAQLDKLAAPSELKGSV
eukprot:g1921.t1